MVDDEELPDVLRRQWARIAAGSAQTELTAPSRVRGWRNAEVMAHLAVQPVLLGRFLADAGTTRARTGLMRLEDNLAGTRALADTIDAAAKRGARAGQVDFARQAAGVDAALAALSAADVTATVVTVQGPIRLADYLRTRCVEAVVHGMDLQPPIAPDSAALAVAVDALMALLRARAPAGLAAARDLPAKEFLDVATGRASRSGRAGGRDAADGVSSGTEVGVPNDLPGAVDRLRTARPGRIVLPTPARSIRAPRSGSVGAVEMR